MSTFDSSNFIKGLPSQPGVYQMYDAADKILYVGKAKNLKNRVGSYFRSKSLNSKTMALVAKISQIQVTVTRTEAEALILEHNLIKAQKPAYNILLKDDKSYPYILISSDKFPRISLHRGRKKPQGQYFGPFPNVSAAKESLNFLQKTFRLRTCENSIFNNRSRPCLQYQINRCTAPCVDLISSDEYATDIDHSALFLQGRSDQLIQQLTASMDESVAELAFEQAADCRDQIVALRSVQSQQGIDAGSGNIDVVGLAILEGLACVHVLYIRQGRMLGSRSYFPKLALDESKDDLLESFLAQFYLSDSNRDLPREIVVGNKSTDCEVIIDALMSKAGRTISISDSVRSRRAQWQAMSVEAATQNLKSKIGSRQNVRKRFESLQARLKLDARPERMECFDISHSSGEKTVASCVVFNQDGPLKSDYRRFNIDGITGGDDYAAMEQALTRRYSRVQEEGGVLPDILVVDGGKGQLSRARLVLEELGIGSELLLLGVAKGSTRKAGFETLFLQSAGQQLVLEGHDPALHLIQHIRDESHRFAITGHRQRRDKQRRTSALEEIEGVGPKRRSQLLRHFGGRQEIAKASTEELSRVEGISAKLAEKIYSALH